MMDRLCPPFTTHVLGDRAGQLPASHRTKKDQIIVPQADIEFLSDELLVKRINAAQDWLWICGRPMPPRPLHYQISSSRDIVITENPELHLLWSSKRMFLKPLPSWLLDPEFWTFYILKDADLAQCARGFLFSYTALIAYESDFRIAQDKGLVPDGISWDSWKCLVREVLQNHDMALVNPRYWYGELRLDRLNTVYRFKGFVFRGYSKVTGHSDYQDLLADNFGILATLLGYVVLILSSLQVGLGVDRLVENTAFVNFSYGFTVFSILAPVVAGFGIFVVVLLMFVSNWIVTKKYEERRFKEIGVEPYWRNKSGKEPTVSVRKRDTSRSKSPDVV
ncbi:hypothetical protein NPX13_g5887 [Xylaria arbuscula]|uniref:Uncharacterized protein n=1 Tax=Xylaria arbuscula TaxID=114810 RepID=A0A9W8NCW5_9PEZI|nr:hypothetical protein NPX13_g5887 [Xylaria arbuscula]